MNFEAFLNSLTEQARGTVHKKNSVIGKSLNEATQREIWAKKEARRRREEMIKNTPGLRGLSPEQLAIVFPPAQQEPARELEPQPNQPLSLQQAQQQQGSQRSHASTQRSHASTQEFHPDDTARYWLDRGIMQPLKRIENAASIALSRTDPLNRAISQAIKEIQSGVKGITSYLDRLRQAELYKGYPTSKGYPTGSRT